MLLFAVDRSSGCHLSNRAVAAETKYQKSHLHLIEDATTRLTESHAKKIEGRVFCKKGCSADGETWEECISECDEICYKDHVLKDQKWSSYIDHSPGLPITLRTTIIN
ncbi:hypothetical protein HRI_004915100 [Hibiscus trionum]|uniref:Uncharacterized protein n=1 Tax=Hibiscus trionum TaxID=183268 RepID=A0A9W7MRR3_HIBTR|nr:hypothetical protein HRI_004915100 [Hibiscus trionum]